MKKQEGKKPAKNLTVRSGVKAGFFYVRRGSVGGPILNRCDTVIGKHLEVRVERACEPNVGEEAKGSKSLKVRTGVKAGFFYVRRGSVGGPVLNRCDTVIGKHLEVRVERACEPNVGEEAKGSKSLKVRTGVKAGFFYVRRGSVGGHILNRCDTVVGKRLEGPAERLSNPPVAEAKPAKSLKVRSGVKAGFFFIRRGSVSNPVLNRCDTVIGKRLEVAAGKASGSNVDEEAKPAKRLKVRTGVKAGFFYVRRGSAGRPVLNRCDTVVGRRVRVRIES